MESVLLLIPRTGWFPFRMHPLGKKAVECTEPPGLASGPHAAPLVAEQALVLWLLTPIMPCKPLAAG